METRFKKVDPTSYEVRVSLTGLVSIQPIESTHFGDGSVWGADPGCEDHYDTTVANDVLSAWDGTLALDEDGRWSIMI